MLLGVKVEQLNKKLANYAFTGLCMVAQTQATQNNSG